MKITEIEGVVVHPGDVLVMRLPDGMEANQFAQHAETFAGIHVVVVESNVEMHVVRGES